MGHLDAPAFRDKLRMALWRRRGRRRRKKRAVGRDMVGERGHPRMAGLCLKEQFFFPCLELHGASMVYK